VLSLCCSELNIKENGMNASEKHTRISRLLASVSLPIWTIGLLAIVYLLVLSQNPTLDAYSYAYGAIVGGDELLMPHHLLYNVWGYALVRIFAFTGAEQLTILQISNIVMSVGCLLITKKILKTIGASDKFTAASLLFCGSCWVFLRFVSDNECYIMPLFFSLGALYYAIDIKQNWLKSVLCACISILFHQIGVLVYLPIMCMILLNKELPFNVFVRSLAVSLIVPIVYVFATYWQTGSAAVSSVVSFVSHDYLSGSADAPDLWQCFSLGIINTFRAFFQMHGYVLSLLKTHWFVMLPLVVLVASLLIMAFVSLFRMPKSKVSVKTCGFKCCVIAVLTLTIVFSFFSNGNAEFMYILPFMAVMLLTMCTKIDARQMAFVAVAVFVWNVSVGAVPYHFCRMNGYSQTAEAVHDHLDSRFLLGNAQWVENIYCYRYRSVPGNLIGIHLYSDSLYRADTSAHVTIYTDCFGGHNAISRASILKVGFPDFLNESQTDSTLLRFENFFSKYEIRRLKY